MPVVQARSRSHTRSVQLPDPTLATGRAACTSVQVYQGRRVAGASRRLADAMVTALEEQDGEAGIVHLAGTRLLIGRPGNGTPVRPQASG